MLNNGAQKLARCIQTLAQHSQSVQVLLQMAIWQVTDQSSGCEQCSHLRARPWDASDHLSQHVWVGAMGALGAVWLGSSLWHVQACVQAVGSTFSQVEEVLRNCRLKAT